ncbi:hypothetical protein [Mucilaginibacter ginsenosidivorax]|uniref:Uncharacterized protein n=1 Tax=Mucilaginibacter ginsenosidivorax TaxID=862126 RepID=A0A5B8VYJ8_9SPHI|nr:hypothetical protein [Mucilaginibacter ginsenosidivorax]QEC75368.1 hypothetical protein FSB76_05200 [Mucilaginibacter ginsenosidivorax]
MNKREQRISERKKRQRVARIKGWWLLLLYGVGIFAFFKSFSLYRDTFIGYQLPLGGGLIFGLVVSFIFNKDYRYYFAPVIPLMGIFTTIMLSVNSLFADKKTVMLKEIIIEKHHQYRRSSPYAIIKFRDFERSIPASTDAEIDSMSYGVLRVNKGLFGYYVIRDKKLVKE